MHMLKKEHMGIYMMDWAKCLMEMEITNLQRTEFKDTLKFIMKKNYV